jgi:queuine tRNA-ribosyltransferase
MPAPAFSFQLQHRTADSFARCSAFTTPHGTVALPAFMPVGTLGTVKGLAVDRLEASGTEFVLANTYHLALRPGAETVRNLGGLHRFMGWSGPILTDSGGYQIFSLANRTRITEQGATFQSHIDGRSIELTPERAVSIQEDLGSDVAMVLDHVVGLPSTSEEVALAMERSLRWAVRCREAATREDQALFGIVQGGLDGDLREESAKGLVALDFPGYAIGGLSVGETHEEMVRTLGVTVPHLPQDRPRYLMGVGRPEDLLQAIGQGVDLFDCVLPTRSGRHGVAFTDRGVLRLKNACHREKQEPLEADCPCVACRYSLGYLRHLFVSGEMLGPILLSIHNVTYYQRLLRGAREAILADRYRAFCEMRYSAWRAGEHEKSAKLSPGPATGP